MPQTYQCDICNAVAGDFMVTFVADGSVICIGVECLPLWALPTAAGWAERLIDQGAETPEWAPIVIDAARQLAGVTDSDLSEPATAPDAATGDDQGPDDPEGLQGRSDGGSGPAGGQLEATTAGAAADD